MSNLEKYYGSENKRHKQKVGWILGGGGGKAAVEGAIFSTSISLKNITHCRLRVWWKRQITVVCRKPLSWFCPTRFCSLWCWYSSHSLSVLVWCIIIIINYILKKWICCEKRLLPCTKSLSNHFYRGMIACIIDFRIILKRLCSEISWCRLNLVRSVKGVLIQSDTELDPENPISCDICCLIIKLLLNWSQRLQWKSFVSVKRSKLNIRYV